jgi:hypothetical protein
MAPGASIHAHVHHDAQANVLRQINMIDAPIQDRLWREALRRLGAMIIGVADGNVGRRLSGIFSRHG